MAGRPGNRPWRPARYAGCRRAACAYEAILASCRRRGIRAGDADDQTNAPNWVRRGQRVAVLTEGHGATSRIVAGWRAGAPIQRDDAWIHLTSGSTVRPGRRRITPRNAAASSREAQTCVRGQPLGRDRGLPGVGGGRRLGEEIGWCD